MHTEPYHRRNVLWRSTRIAALAFALIITPQSNAAYATSAHFAPATLCGNCFHLFALWNDNFTPDDAFVLKPKRFFGSSPDDEAKDASPSAGGSLGVVVAIERLSKGQIAVLDAQYRKVVIFDSTGKVRRVISRGRGMGPGELSFPTAMTVAHDTIAIFDYQQSRITLFDTAGKLLTTTPAPRAKDIAIVNGALWGTQMPGLKEMLWQKSFTGGIESARKFLSVDARQAEFYPKGAIARLGKDFDGDVLVAHHRPGLWYTLGVDASIQGPWGVELFAHEKAFESTQGVLSPPGETAAIAGISNSQLAILYSHAAGQGRGKAPHLERQLALFSKTTRALLGTVAYSGEWAKASPLAPGLRAGELYYFETEPYPRVVLAEVVPNRKP